MDSRELYKIGQWFFDKQTGEYLFVSQCGNSSPCSGDEYGVMISMSSDISKSEYPSFIPAKDFYKMMEVIAHHSKFDEYIHHVSRSGNTPSFSISRYGDDYDVWEDLVVGKNNEDVRAVRLMLDKRSDRSITPLVINYDDPLFLYINNKFLIEKVLDLWVSYHAKPEVLLEKQNYLVIQISPVDHPPIQLWFWMEGGSPTTREIVVRAIGDKYFELRNAESLEVIWPEIKQLPEGHKWWTLQVGHDSAKGGVTLSLAEGSSYPAGSSNAATDRRVHLLLGSTLTDGQSWDQGFGDEAMRASRRRCTTYGELIKALTEVQSSEDKITTNKVDLALSDPNGYNERYRPLRQLPDPFVRLNPSLCP